MESLGKPLYMDWVYRLNVKHLFMLRKTRFYRHLYLSKISCIICFVYDVDECMKSGFLPLHVAIEM